MENKNPTIREVARLAGVSTTTISRYINGSGYVGERAARSIGKVIDEIGYRPSIAAQGLKSQRSRIILLVVPDIMNPFYSKMAKEAQRLAETEDYTLMLYDTNEDMAAELSAISLIPRLYISGLMLASIQVSPDVLSAVSAAGVPTVLVNSYHEGEFDTVHCAHGEGTLVAARHLLGLGHRRIAFAGGVADSAIGGSRRDGYHAALNEYGVAPVSEYLFEEGFSQEAGYAAGGYFAGLRERPTAICCANDLIALGVIAALGEKGLGVPDEISVIGMDDIPYAPISNPPLSTVTNDGAEFARLAAGLLFDRISGREAGAPRRLTVTNELVARRSCAPPRHID